MEESSVVSGPEKDMTDVDNDKPLDMLTQSEQPTDQGTVFKKPIILPKMAVKKTSAINVFSNKNANKQMEEKPETIKKEADKNVDDEKVLQTAKPMSRAGLSPAEILKQKETPICYKEPGWSGLAEEAYSFEVLKNGIIVDKIDLCTKPYYVVGRLVGCDYQMDHPSLSRYHAVIQYCKVKTENHSVGWYLYDLDSTHGTWMNKTKVKPRVYNRLRVGYVIKFGGSTRLHILQGPSEDMEEESALSITELKEQRQRQKREVEILKAADTEDNQSAMAVQKPNEGCSWGMDTEDASEINSENPFAVLEAQNEELYIDDPKKALRGFFEREGFDPPEYHVEEEGRGKFYCTVELPLDSPSGKPLVAEASACGKKREAVVACALEACRMIDKCGELRKSHHESRKRKAKNWADNDFYDSDEDVFFDRTGDIEKKRQQRMKRTKILKQKALTYVELKSNLQEVEDEIAEIQQKLDKEKKKAMDCEEADGVDVLDAFMASIKSGSMDSKTKMELKRQQFSLRAEQQRLIKLVNMAKPPDLPPLPIVTNLATGKQGSQKSMPLFGKMRGPVKGTKGQRTAAIPQKTKPDNAEDDEEEEEEDDDDDVATNQKAEIEKNKNGNGKTEEMPGSSDKRQVARKEAKAAASSIRARIQRILGPSRPPKLQAQSEDDEDSSREQLKSDIGSELPKIEVRSEQPKSDVRTEQPKSDVESEQPKSDVESEQPKSDGKSEQPKSDGKSEQPKSDGKNEKTQKDDSGSEQQRQSETKEPQKGETRQASKRIRPKRLHKVQPEEDASGGYDADNPNYAMWLPPEDQSGDGKTSLNKKLGY